MIPASKSNPIQSSTSLSCESQADVMLFVGKLHSAYLFQIDSDLVLSDATPSTQTTSSNRMKNMSSAGKLFYILFKEIMQLQKGLSAMILNRIPSHAAPVVGGVQ